MTHVDTSDDSKVWHIHGNRYDLNPFLSQHPGGSNILLAAKGVEDSTPLFESYHVFANRVYIRSKLKEFQLVGPGKQPLYTFLPQGFYDTVSTRAREEFGAKSEWDSVTSAVKANTFWKLKVGFETSLFLVCWYLCFFFSWESVLMRFLLSFFTGMLFISLGFNTMHDASHFALGNRNHWLNAISLRAWTSFAMWSSQFWMTHHVIRHHSFTGHSELDPDVHHARPFLRKSIEIPSNKYLVFPLFLQRNIPLLVSLVFVFFPGMFVGQILSYVVLWKWRKHLWKMKLPSKQAFTLTWAEIALFLISLGSHVYAASPAASLGYFLGCNLAYAICILPDHDTVECSTDNHVLDSESKDWGEVQTRHSSDFISGFPYKSIFSHLSGGINYQICHHLFPSVCHVHFSKLDAIVQRVCEEFNVPKVVHPTLWSALSSVVQTFELTTGGESKKNPRLRRLRSRMDWFLLTVWVSLCSVAVYKRGQHLLGIPFALVCFLCIFWQSGVFQDVPQHRRFARLQQLTLVLSLSVYSVAMTGDFKSYALMQTALLACELFVIIWSRTFVSTGLIRIGLIALHLVRFTFSCYFWNNDDSQLVASSHLEWIGLAHLTTLLLTQATSWTGIGCVLGVHWTALLLGSGGGMVLYDTAN